MSRLLERFTLGALEVVALSDGAPDRSLDGFFDGAAPAEWTRAVGVTSAADAVPFNFGSFLVRGDGHTTLIDTGFGAHGRSLGVPGGGELLLRLAEAGARREDVDRVVHTHLHVDHCGWNLDDDAGGAITFPNATFHLHAAELAYWTGPASDTNSMAAGARGRINPLVAAGRVQTFEGSEHALYETLTLLHTPGHTPGHVAALLSSQGQHLVVVGDAAHHPVHFEHHDWVPGVDVDPAASARSRGVLAALAADRDALVTGGHFPILSLGHVRRVEGGYRWQPV